MSIADEVGTLYFILIIFLFAAVFLDLFIYFRVFIAKKIDLKEYCNVGIKFTKLVMYFFFGLIVLYIGFTGGLSDKTVIVHYIVGFLLIADALSGVILKVVFGKK